MEATEQWTTLAPSPRPLTGEDKWNVFLSYRSVNRAWVLNLYDVLRGHGHAVFLDQVTIKAGDPLTRVLEDGLRGSQAGVLVWSTAAADSEWVSGTNTRPWSNCQRPSRGFCSSLFVLTLMTFPCSPPIGFSSTSRHTPTGPAEASCCAYCMPSSVSHSPKRLSGSPPNKTKQRAER